jgi:hypothetical protein
MGKVVRHCSSTQGPLTRQLYSVKCAALCQSSPPGWTALFLQLAQRAAKYFMNLAADVDICRQCGTADFPNLVHGTPQLADRDLDLLHGTGAGVQQTETVGLVRVTAYGGGPQVRLRQLILTGAEADAAVCICVIATPCFPA